VKRSQFQPGDRVRLNLPGSKLHGMIGTLKAPRPPAGWWLVIADQPLEQEGETLTGELARSFIAPDLWLELVGRAVCPVEAPEAPALKGATFRRVPPPKRSRRPRP
jgi:hypothetical protein